VACQYFRLLFKYLVAILSKSHFMYMQIRMQFTFLESVFSRDPLTHLGSELQCFSASQYSRKGRVVGFCTQTPWCHGLFEEPPVVQFHNFPTNYGTQRFIALITGARLWFLSANRLIVLFVGSHLILSFHLMFSSS
jgi:hypothetical protein